MKKPSITLFFASGPQAIGASQHVVKEPIAWLVRRHRKHVPLRAPGIMDARAGKRLVPDRLLTVPATSRLPLPAA